MSKSSFEGFPSPKPIKTGTNTGDATAVAGDLGSGVTAYNRFGKIIGTGANFGNAAVSDVSNGKTFSSSNGTLATGTGANAKRRFTGSGTSSAGGVLTITGLPFQPSVILVEWRTVTPQDWSAIYNVNATYPLSYDRMHNNISGNAAITWSVSASGFILSVMDTNMPVVYTIYE